MRDLVKVLCGILTFFLIFTIPGLSEEAQARQLSGGTVHFRVGSSDFKVIRGARVIVIADNGIILSSGLTNSTGEWTVSIPAQQDMRFQGVRELDTVTAITVANGYNEAMTFEIPVTSNTVQPIILNSIQPNKRNEPKVHLGNLHRHDVIKAINKYAEQLKLQRQQPIPGEQGYAPWSPNTNR